MLKNAVFKVSKKVRDRQPALCFSDGDFSGSFFYAGTKDIPRADFAVDFHHLFQRLSLYQISVRQKEVSQDSDFQLYLRNYQRHSHSQKS